MLNNTRVYRICSYQLTLHKVILLLTPFISVFGLMIDIILMTVMGVMRLMTGNDLFNRLDCAEFPCFGDANGGSRNKLQTLLSTYNPRTRKFELIMSLMTLITAMWIMKIMSHMTEMKGDSNKRLTKVKKQQNGSPFPWVGPPILYIIISRFVAEIVWGWRHFMKKLSCKSK